MKPVSVLLHELNEKDVVPLIYKNFLARSVQEIFVAAIFSKSSFSGVMPGRCGEITDNRIPEAGKGGRRRWA